MPKSINIIKDNKGLTLIEIIVALLLVAILTAGAGMGLVAITQGYLFAGKNAAMAQKANIAMKRMSIEFKGIILVTQAQTDPGFITFLSANGTQTIGFDNNAIKIAQDSDPIANGDILMDGITDLAFTFTDNTGGPWVVTDNIEDLTGITISFNVTRSDISAGTISFTTTVYLRSNNNSGGII